MNHLDSNRRWISWIGIVVGTILMLIGLTSCLSEWDLNRRAEQASAKVSELLSSCDLAPEVYSDNWREATSS